MKYKEPWEKEREMKYEFHDIVVSDLTELEILAIKDRARHDLVLTKESNATKATIDSFLALLTKKGYRVVKND